MDMMEDMILKDRIWKIETKIKKLKKSTLIDRKINQSGSYVLFNVKFPLNF